MSRRVVITGIGVVSPLGLTPEELWSGLSGRQSGVAALRSLPADALPTPFGAEAWSFRGQIEDFGPLEKKTQREIKKNLKVMCREIEMAVAAAQRALGHAGWRERRPDPERAGVVFGADFIVTAPDEFATAVAKCLDDQGRFDFGKWGETGIGEVAPLWLLKYLPNMPASHIAIYNDFRGPSNSLTMREASSNLAVGEAFTTIQRGAADMVLAGATGTRLHPLRAMHVVLQEEIAAGDLPPEEASRPFDAHRRGMVLGEGAGALVLEELNLARARGATIWGEVLGAGSSTVLDRQGVADLRAAAGNALRQALRQAGLEPARVGHVHAHGLATRHADAQEAQALHALWGDRVPVVAAKANFGNLGAAGGMVELAASLLAMRAGKLFPQRNYTQPDPDCPVRMAVSGEEPAGDVVVNLSFSPQGQASAVVVAKSPEMLDA